MITKQNLIFLAVGLSAATSLTGSEDEEALFELEAFIVEEAAQTQIETLSPASANVDSFLWEAAGPEAVPRGLSVLTPELLETLEIESYAELDRYGAGTQRINYFGLAGSPVIRGARGGTYFNGMLRAYQRNEMPVSFGALESLEVIKGPVPAGFSPTLVGGAVNQIPKSPFYNEEHGTVEVRIGSWQERHLELDYGAPFLLGDRPAAYRISYTRHRAERFYRNVDHDYDSLYAAMKVKLTDRWRLFFGGEFYDFRSSEIPGINRPTRELVERGDYVIGEAPALVSEQWGGTVERRLLQFPYTLTVNPALFALAIPGETARAEIPAALRARMLDLNDPHVVKNLYTVLPEAEVPPFAIGAREEAAEILAALPAETADAYLYTPEYFAAGGEALTRKLAEDAVLSDPRDRADSQDGIIFADLEGRLAGDQRLHLRFFAEGLSTEKRSTYGFALDTEQVVLNTRLAWRGQLPAGLGPLTVGLDLRYQHAETLQDFDAEPFGRRDLSRDFITDNSVVAAGPARGPDGLNLWSSFGNASQESGLWQAAVFAGGQVAVSERISIHYGGRLEQAFWEASLPAAVERASPAQRRARSDSGQLDLWQLHINPRVEVAPGIYLYGAGQLGSVLAPGDGGAVSGPKNFPDAELLEGGMKANLYEGRFYTSLSFYHWDQASFSSLDAQARPLRAKGAEWEMTAAITPRLTLLGALTAQRVYLRGDTLGFGTLPQDEAGWALTAGVLTAAGNRRAPENPEMIFGGIPEVSGHLYAVWEPVDGWQLAAGPLWRDGFYHNMERSLRIPSHVLWNASLGYETKRWWVRVRVENALDADYWIGQEPVFAAGALLLQGTGRGISVTAGWRF